eukprot:TRINITY_DN9874_c0_g1_i1.p1 TRINITY_DN9874_c0_g1~~TRINITY_DN9874_c0_g1_i1.p1  ORF type:complete len:1165 (+),score=271.00 TRINITY_DN9874_c0_g1_i1:26-3520(+)
MYFVYGQPKLFTSPGEVEDIIDIQCFFEDNATFPFPLFAVATSNTILIWSGGRDRVLLGSYSLHDDEDEDAKEEEGTFVNIQWGTGYKLAARTSRGYVQIFKVVVESDRSVSIQGADHVFAASIENFPIIRLDRTLVIFPEGGAKSIVHMPPNSILVGTNGGALQRMDWEPQASGWMSSSQVIQSESALLKSIPTASNSGDVVLSSNICALSYCEELRVVGIVCDDGSSALLQLSGKSLHNIRGRLLIPSNSACIAINPKYRLVAIGTNTGHIELYHVTGQFARKFSVEPWGATPEGTGRISCLKWCPHDDHVLAASWAKSGVSLWSIYGCRLMSSLPLWQHQSKTRPPEYLNRGVLALAWGDQSYHLLVSYLGDRGGFTDFSILKSGLANNPNLNMSERILLQGADRILMLAYKGRELDEISWEHLQVPSTYLTDNWPIKFVAVSRDGNMIAAAGKRGFCIYNLKTYRWKLFGDRNQEQQIVCQSLAWYHHNLVAATYNIYTRNYSLLIYRGNHLDREGLVHESLIPLKRMPHLMDCNDDFLVLFTLDSFFYQYSLHPQYSSDKKLIKVDLKLIHQVSMAQIQAPLSLTLLPGIVDHKNKTIGNGSNCLILSSTGGLQLCNAEDIIQVTLANDVEQFWVANYQSDKSSSPEEFENTLWAYGQSGLQVWFPFDWWDNQIQSSPLMARDRSLDFDLEVYPIGFVDHLGVIVGLTQEVTTNSSSQLPVWDIKIRLHPFVHKMLWERISHNDEDGAERIAQNFSSIPHFSHSLELLLHDALESHPSKNSDPKAKTMLASVIAFLRQFPQFPEIVVQCARKRDPSVWPKLFAQFGCAPEVLFTQALQHMQLSTAASYLRILWYLRGPKMARRGGLRLLERTLIPPTGTYYHNHNHPLPSISPHAAVSNMSSVSNNIADRRYSSEGEMFSPQRHGHHVTSPIATSESRSGVVITGDVLSVDDRITLAGDLVRFLQPVEESETSVWESFNALVPGSDELLKLEMETKSGTFQSEAEENYLQDLMLSRYARKLLLQKQIRKFLQFAKATHKDVIPWLVKERRRAAQIEEWTSAIDIVHLQFNLPYSTSPKPLLDNKINDSITEMWELMRAMKLAECWDWVLVLCTPLFNVDEIEQVLKHHPELWKPYKEMLAQHPCLGYSILKDDLTNIFG